LNYFTGICQGLKVSVEGTYHFFIIGYLPDHQDTFQHVSFILETRSSDAAIMKILQSGALVLEKK
jgi:hypothetical protein